MNTPALDFAVDEAALIADLLIDLPNNHRADWLATQFGRMDIVFFQDGPLLRQMTNEAIRCFVNGEFIATVLLAFSIAERSIAGRLLAAGDTGVREERDLGKLLKRACVRGWISKQELKHVTDVCSEFRNSLAHIRTSTEPGRHERRANDSACSLSEIVESDARALLAMAFLILGKTSI